MTTYKAVAVDEKNIKAPDEPVRIIEKKMPQPGPNEALVRIYLRPVNPSDCMSVIGVYAGFKPASYPATPGLEGVGKVVELGPSCSGRIKRGDRVVAVPWNGAGKGDGTWQQYALVEEANLIPVPESVTDESASQFLVNPVTAYGFLETLKVPQGEYLLQGAAGSTLGRQLIAMAKHRGVKTINVVRRREQAQELLDIGADEVIVSTEEGVVDRVKQITNRKLAYAAVDPIGGEFTKDVAAAVRRGGTVYVYGALGGTTVTVGLGDLLFRGVHVTGFWLSTWLAELGPKSAEVLKSCMDLMAKGIIVPTAGKKFPLEEANEAIKESQREARGAKIFLEG